MKKLIVTLVLFGIIVCASAQRKFHNTIGSTADNIQHARIYSTNLGAGQSEHINVLWAQPFTDNMYTMNCSLVTHYDELGFMVMQKDQDGAVVVVYNKLDSQGFGVQPFGEVNCIAIHD